MGWLWLCSLSGNTLGKNQEKVRVNKLKKSFVETGSTRVRHVVEANGEQWFTAERYEFCVCPYCDRMHWTKISDLFYRLQDAIACAKKDVTSGGKYTGIYLDEEYAHLSY